MVILLCVSFFHVQALTHTVYILDIQACINPNPRTAVNRTHSGFKGYETMMFFFGFIWGIANLGMMAAVIGETWSWEPSSFKNSRAWGAVKLLFVTFILFPISAVLIIIPFFGGWIVLPLAQKVRYLSYAIRYKLTCLLARLGSPL